MDKITAIITICITSAIAAAQQISFPTQGNGTTYHSGTNGASAGRTQTSGNTAYHYNSNGSSAGRSRTVGNTTYHYNANGSSAGRSQVSSEKAKRLRY